MMLFGSCVASALVGLVLTKDLSATPGLAPADSTRIWSNGLAEAFLDLAFGFALSIPSVIVSLKARRKISAPSQ